MIEEVLDCLEAMCGRIDSGSELAVEDASQALDSLTTDPIEILPVEDSPGDVALVQHALGKSELGCRVHVAHDGLPALRAMCQVLKINAMPWATVAAAAAPPGLDRTAAR